MIFKTGLIGLVLLLTSCLFDHGVKWRDDPYEVIWIDNSHSLDLVYNVGGGSVGRVGPGVVAVGSNNHYVVAKTKSESFYYVDRQQDSKYSGTNSVTGPLSNEEFLELKEKLTLPEFSEKF